MDIGKLNRRIKILGFVEERDEYGGISGEWQVLGQKWAKIEPSGGNETNDNNQVKAVGNVSFVMRFCPNLTEKNRISYGKSIYEINSVRDADTGHYMTIANCTELKDGV